MRPATWKYIESTPALERLYRAYRRMPEPLRTPLRAFGTPAWTLATRMILKRSRERVMAGPFLGMELKLAPVSRRHLLSYVLGTTELELHRVINRVIDTRYPTIINIGAADGYYAVGLAKRSTGSQVVAFEAKEELHEALRHVAEANGVADRITYRGLCDEAGLASALAEAVGPALLFVDIEGAEAVVLDPSKAAQLATADILVETHDVYAPGCTETLIERFSATHTIERYVARPRVLADFPAGLLPALPRLFPGLAVDLMDERRDGIQEWLFMIAHDRTGVDSQP